MRRLKTAADYLGCSVVEAAKLGREWRDMAAAAVMAETEADRSVAAMEEQRRRMKGKV